MKFLNVNTNTRTLVMWALLGFYSFFIVSYYLSKFSEGFQEGATVPVQGQVPNAAPVQGPNAVQVPAQVPAQGQAATSGQPPAQGKWVFQAA